MAVELTESVRAKSEQTNLLPSLVMQIDGVDTLYGCAVLKKYIRIGDTGLEVGDSWVIGGKDEVEDQSDLMTLEGTTTSISQQLLQDKGGTSSVSSMQIALIDPFDEATKLITPGEVVEDLLGRQARVWLSYADASFPEDYVILFNGIISAIQADSKVTLTISSPEVKKSQDIFTKISTTVAGIEQAVTFSLADPGIATSADHGLEANQAVKFTTDGELPPNLTAGKTYYVRNPTTDTFEIATQLDGVAISTLWKASVSTTVITGTRYLHHKNHRLSLNDAVVFATTGALPSGLTAGVTYYAIVADADYFLVSATPSGSAIVLSTAGSGNNYVWGKQSGAHTVLIGVGEHDTSLDLDSTEGFNQTYSDTPSGEADPNITYFLRIDDELIQYTGISGDTITGCVRGALGTVKSGHSIGASVDSFYRLQGTGPELALKVLMSGKNGPWETDIPVKYFVDIGGGLEVSNAIYFDYNVERELGIVAGDYVTISGATETDNNFTNRQIRSVLSYLNGTYIVVDGADLVIETGTSAVAEFRSQYDVLGIGAGMGGDEVDVNGFQRIIDLFVSSFPDYDFYITDTITARDFCDTEILFPCGAYSIPRKGRVSCGFTSPPIAVESIPDLDSTQVKEPDKTTIQRSIGKSFYNAVVYKLEVDALDDSLFKSGQVFIDSGSVARIPVGAHPLVITSKGLRSNATTNAILDTNSRRFLNRYRYGAELVKASVQYGAGWQIEVGDVVLYGDNDLLLPDTKYGTRAFTPRLMEVVNKSMNIRSGEVKLDLLDTNYLTDGRYGIFSPSSVITGGTATAIRITESFGIADARLESDKWRRYAGCKILLHDEDWSVTHSTRLVGVSASDPHVLIVDSIGTTPAAGWIVDLENYQHDAKLDQAIPKSFHCFFTPQVEVTFGASGTQFDVGSGDVAKILVGAKVIIHTDQWDSASDEVEVTDVSGTTITVGTDLGFTPDSTFLVDLVGFEDGGFAYRFV